MIVLGIETSGNVGGVALCDDDKLIAQTTFRSGMVHGKALVPAVARPPRQKRHRPRRGSTSWRSPPGRARTPACASA